MFRPFVSTFWNFIGMFLLCIGYAGIMVARYQHLIQTLREIFGRFAQLRGHWAMSVTLTLNDRDGGAVMVY